ncbi:MAG: DUF1616 domain-containing protein, partial [Candidatus Bathyarchaeia archaeon]
MSKNLSESELSQTIVQVIREKDPKTVEELIEQVKERLLRSDSEIMATILGLQREGKLDFTKPPESSMPSFTVYMRTEHTLWYWLIVATSVATATVVFATPEDLFPFVYIRYVLGAIFVLCLPGYTLIRALFPPTQPKETPKAGLDTIERITLSLGMSLAIVPIVGMLLNYTPWGIRLTTIVLSLLSLTLVFATTAVTREQ